MKKVIILIIVLFAFVGDASAKGKDKSRFYDFSDQMINGEIKKPSTIYIDTRTRAKFEKLLKLKKSFYKALMLTAKEAALK